MNRFVLWRARQDPFFLSVDDHKPVLDSWEKWDGPVKDRVYLPPDTEYPFSEWDMSQDEPLEECK